MSGNKVFITSVWDTNNNTGSGLSMSQVSTFVTNATAGLLKTDGTRPMVGSLDVNQKDILNIKSLYPPNPGNPIDVDGSLNMKNYSLDNIQALTAVSGGTLKVNSDVDIYGTIDLQNAYEIVNPKIPQSPSSLALVSSVDDLYHSLEGVYMKDATNIIPVTGQIITASSFHAASHRPENVFDGNLTTQWAIDISEVNATSWIQIQIPSPVSIWKLTLHPRTGIQMTTHIVERFSLEGSNDGISYTLIFKAVQNVNTVVTNEFKVSRPYTYFRLTTAGKFQYGLSAIELFTATPINKSYVDIASAHLPGGGITKTTGGLQLESDVVRFTSPTNLPTSNLSNRHPLFAVADTGTGKIHYSSSWFTLAPSTAVPPTQTTDLTPKSYVDSLTSYASGGGITKVAGSFTLEPNVYRFVANVDQAPFISQALPICAEETGSGRRVIGESHLTVPAWLQSPSRASDIVNKQYVDSALSTSFTIFAASRSLAVAANSNIRIDSTLDSANWNNEISLDTMNNVFSVNTAGTYRVSFSILAWAWGSNTPQIRIERVGAFRLVLVDRVTLPSATNSYTLKNVSIRRFPTVGERYRIFCNVACTHWVHDQCWISFEKLSV